MKLRSTAAILAAYGILGPGLIGVDLAVAQTAPEEKPLLSNQAFKNIQVLKGIPVDDFTVTMGIILK